MQMPNRGETGKIERGYRGLNLGDPGVMERHYKKKFGGRKI